MDADGVARFLGITRDEFDVVRISRLPRTLKDCIEIALNTVPPERQELVTAWIAHICDIPTAG